jgi:predicted transcriptional regulator
MLDAIALLQDLGFTEQEARAYQALLQHNPVTGYELAKVSGIPRPNIYPVLQKLETRGAAMRVAGDETVRYSPVAPEEFLQRIEDQFQATRRDAAAALQQLAQPAAADYIWNTHGYANLLAQARRLIAGAAEGLLIALWPDEARALAPDLAAAEQRGQPITTLCLAGCAEECGGCRGRILRNMVIETPDARWLLLVASGEEMLAGEIPTDQEVTVVRTRQPLLVNMTSWFIQHAMALGVLLADAGDVLEHYLAPATHPVLAEVDPHGPESWPAYMRRLLRSEGNRNKPAATD